MSLDQILLLNIPPLILCSIMMVGAAILSIAGTLIFHRYIPQRNFKNHNDIAGPIFSTLGVIYAVLLGFMVVVVWQDFDRAKLNAEKEVNCLANLYIDSEPFEGAFKRKVHSGIGRYARAVVDEWNILAMGGYNLKAKEAIRELIVLYSNYSPRSETEKVFFASSINKLNELFDLRMLRLIDAREGIHPLLWFVLIAGGIITIVFTIFFGTESLSAKIGMSTFLAVLISLVLFTILEFSLPFTGSARISCESFKQLLVQLGL